MASAIDSPTGAVLVLLSASTGSGVLAAGGSAQTAVETVMFVFTAATLLSGAILYIIGIARWAGYFRFVPYFVVGGFLAATGWFLFSGGIRMAAGHKLTLASLTETWTLAQSIKLAGAAAVLAVLLSVRRWVKWAFAMPIALVAMWLFGSFVLMQLGLTEATSGYYLPSLGALTRWNPFKAFHTTQLSWPMLASLTPQMLAVTIVSLISLVTKISSIELTRQASGDLDCEFRAHGLANLIALPCGGIANGVQIGASSLLKHAGGATRVSGVFAALALGAVALSSFDLPGMIPIPIVAGLVFYLGYTFFMEAFRRPYAQRAWFDIMLATAMMILCIEYGFLVGVVAGLICACVLFAVSYARTGVVRRHVTRSDFASHVVRATDAADYLREHGDAIQMYWLSGYIFFGSSESVFERIRRDIEALRRQQVAHVVLDFRTVKGTDSSAVVSFSKLRNFCDRLGIGIVYCSLSPANRASLEGGGLIGGKSRHKAFADIYSGLAWCEDELLSASDLNRNLDVSGFEPWFQQELGATVAVSDILSYLDRKDMEMSEVLYREGEPADTIDIIAAGNLAVDITRADGGQLRIRRLMTHAVVGEMGFFRRSIRAATVSSDGPAILFTLTRPNFERMRRERPDLAAAFDDFVLRALADRVDFANHAIAALSV
jgi:SulP family sulfate permease